MKIGEHTLKVVLNNNVEVATKFTIDEETKEIETENPKTSDNVIKYLILSMASVLGIATTLLINKKLKIRRIRK